MRLWVRNAPPTHVVWASCSRRRPRLPEQACRQAVRPSLALANTRLHARSSKRHSSLYCGRVVGQRDRPPTGISIRPGPSGVIESWGRRPHLQSSPTLSVRRCANPNPPAQILILRTWTARAHNTGIVCTHSTAHRSRKRPPPQPATSPRARLATSPRPRLDLALTSPRNLALTSP